jgi:HPt (histidine-containing phosphotransfer) domain-containing protein
MALHYNLSKVYQLSDNDSEFVNQILVLFVNEIPKDLLEIKTGIYSELHKEVFAYAHKIKPTLDLLGMHVAFEEIVLIEAWAKAEGKTKNIKETYKSVKSQVKNAIKEIKKDFNL